MSNIGNKYKVGVLAIVASAILILGLISLGTFKYFKITYPFMTAVSTSVQGLEIGAKVKIKGVTIGSVDKIHLGPEMKVTYIYMKFVPEAFEKVATVKPQIIGLNQEEYVELFKKRISELVDQGLRCQLGYGDITGSMFIDIADFDEKAFPPIVVELPPDHPPYIPAVPTATIGSIISEINMITKNLSQVNMKGLSDDLKLFIEKSNKILDVQEFKGIIAQVQSISENLNALTIKANDVLDKKHVEEITGNIQATFAKINSTLDSIEKLSEETKNEIKNAKIPETSQKARNLIDNSNSAVRNIDLLRNDLRNSIVQLSETLQTTRQLIDYLERNPNSLISGKPDKPVVDAE